jgi:hypothetical protein
LAGGFLISFLEGFMARCSNKNKLQDFYAPQLTVLSENSIRP